MKKLFKLLFFVCVSLNSLAQIPSTGLIGFWPFNNNANDSSGNGYDGIVTGAISTNDRFGNSNAAFLFGDTSKYITVADAVPLRLSNTDFTISLWINQTNNLSSQEAILTKRGTGNQNGYILNITGSASPLPGLVNYQVSGGIDPKALTDSIVSVGTWHHIVCLYSVANQNLKIYVDGILNADETGIPSPNAATNANIVIGKDVSTGDYPFNGKIDDIAIYDRALSLSEIQQLFSSCSTVDISTNVIAQYDFAGDANDDSGNNHNGTISGATLTTDRFGNANHAYSFNGSTSAITVPDHPALRLSNTDYTISAWIRQNIPVINNAAIIAKRTGSGQNGYLLNINGSSTSAPGHLNFSVSGGTDPKAVSNSVVSPNMWHHVAVVYDLNTTTMLTYIDGILNSAHNGIPTPNSATSINMNIGSDGAGNPYFFNGKIDDIRIYNRMLSPCDIDSLFKLPDPVLSGLHDLNAINGGQFYPNPANDKINVIVASPVTMIFRNSVGQTVKSFAVSDGNYTIDISDLSPGIYFVTFMDNKSNSVVRKLIKN